MLSIGKARPGLFSAPRWLCWHQHCAGAGAGRGEARGRAEGSVGSRTNRWTLAFRLGPRSPPHPSPQRPGAEFLEPRARLGIIPHQGAGACHSGRTWELITGRKSEGGGGGSGCCGGSLQTNPSPSASRPHSVTGDGGLRSPVLGAGLPHQAQSPSSIETPWPRGSPPAQRFLEGPPRSQHSPQSEH